MSTQQKRLQHLESKKNATLLRIPQDFIQFNNLIGLPKHPATFEPMDLMNYQKNFFQDHRKHRLSQVPCKQGETNWVNRIDTKNTSL